MYGCESWTVKKAECQRIDAFELWCWRRLLRVPWTARRSNQSILKEISRGGSLERMMLKLNPVLWPPHAKSWLIGKVSDAGRDWEQEKKETIEDEMAGWYHQLDGHKFEWTLGVGGGQRGLECCNSWGLKESATTEWLSWTELNKCMSKRMLVSFFTVAGPKHIFFVSNYEYLTMIVTLTYMQKYYKQCLSFHLCLWKKWMKILVHCRKWRNKFLWSTGFRFQNVCPWKMWQNLKTRSAKIFMRKSKYLYISPEWQSLYGTMLWKAVIANFKIWW